MTETNAFGEQVEALLRAAAGKAVERATSLKNSALAAQ